MRTKSMLIGAAYILLVGCIPSFNPFYSDRDTAFDSALLGTWREDSSTWTFAPHPDGDAYLLTMTSGEDSDGAFKATLFELGAHRFLDLVPEEYDYPDSMPELVFASLFPGHLVLHVAQIEPVLEVALFDPDWVAELIEENPKALSHRIEAERILLTGKTRELQRFLRRYVDSEGLFDDYSEMSKQPEA